MEAWPSALISGLLLLWAVLLMLLHVRTWRQAQRQDALPEDLDYRRRQFRRRMQTSALLAVLAVAIFVGPLIPGPPLVLIAYWIGALLVLAWVALLALADVVATKLHFARLRADYLTEQAKLKVQLRRMRAARGSGQSTGGNGHAPGNGDGRPNGDRGSYTLRGLN